MDEPYSLTLHAHRKEPSSNRKNMIQDRKIQGVQKPHTFPSEKITI